MKKVINDVNNIVDEMVSGLTLAYPNYVKRIAIAEAGQAVVVPYKRADTGASDFTGCFSLFAAVYNYFKGGHC